MQTRKLNLEGFVKSKTIETRKKDTADNFIQVKNKVIFDNSLSDEGFRLFSYLKTHDLATYSPGYKQIMDDLKWSRSKVVRAIRDLESHNLVKRISEGTEFLKLIILEDYREINKNK